MARRIITNPKFIVEHDGNNLVLKFRDGNIYKPIEFNNAQFSGKKNMVISQPNLSIIDDNLFVNVNGHDVKIGEVGDGYTLASELTRNSIVEPNLDVVITSNGGASVVTEINGKNITINGGNEPANRLYYTVVEGGVQPSSIWITTNCSDNVFDPETGEGYLVLNDGVTELTGIYNEQDETYSTTFSDNVSPDNGYAEENIVSVIIPKSITRISDNAFIDYHMLENFTCSESLTEIGNNAFKYCSNLDHFIMPDSLEVLGSYSFYGCESLNSVYISNKLNIIKEYTFALSRDPKKWTEIEIPSSVTRIEEYAFQNNKSLSELKLNNGIVKIDQYAFNESPINSLIIPESLEEIGYKCFRMPKDNKVTCLATTPPKVGAENFGCKNISITTLYVPASSVSAYENHNIWPNLFGTIQSLPIDDN